MGEHNEAERVSNVERGADDRERLGVLLPDPGQVDEVGKLHQPTTRREPERSPVAAERVDTIGGVRGGGARRVPPITRLQEKAMSSRLNPYLNFNGNARQALEFYQSVFGGTLNINTFADFGGNDSPDADKVMHGQLESDAGYTVMAADHASNMGEYHPPSGFGISLSGDDGDALRGYWEKLSASGNTTLPMQKQTWGDEFGMVVDKFGITWLVNISQPQA